MGGDNFNKSDFNKTPMPFCDTCGMICVNAEPSDAEMIVFVKSTTSYSTKIITKCKNCQHPVNQTGGCILQEFRRCSACSGRPKCNTCGKISSTLFNQYVNSMFRCTSCDHPLDDDGNCVKADTCVSCNPTSCNTCERNVEGELDSDGEIECSYCEHYIDSYGDCQSQNRGHCDTCDGSYPDCPACDNELYEDGYEDDDGDYVHRYSCNDCSHTLDSDGDCEDAMNGACSDCNTKCSSCDAWECDNGSDCSYRAEGRCSFCHCNHSALELPDCPNCGDDQNVEGPDSDGDYWCEYHNCDSSNYFT